MTFLLILFYLIIFSFLPYISYLNFGCITFLTKQKCTFSFLSDKINDVAKQQKSLLIIVCTTLEKKYFLTYEERLYSRKKFSDQITFNVV